MGSGRLYREGRAIHKCREERTGFIASESQKRGNDCVALTGGKSVSVEASGNLPGIREKGTDPVAEGKLE